MRRQSTYGAVSDVGGWNLGILAPGRPNVVRFHDGSKGVPRRTRALRVRAFALGRAVPRFGVIDP